MRNVVKSTILGMGLLAGVAFGAYAQTDNVAALPPGAQAPTPPAAAVAPSAELYRPEARRTGVGQEKQTQTVRPSRSLCRPEARRMVVLRRKSRPQPVAQVAWHISAARARTDRRHSVRKQAGRRQRRPVLRPAITASPSITPPSRSGTCGGTGTASCRRGAADRQPRPARRRPPRSGCARARRAPRAAATSQVPLVHSLTGFGAVEHLQILGLPDVERGRARRQQVVIDGGLGDRRRPQQRFEHRPPRPVERRLGDRGMRRRAEIARHLHRQHAARLEAVKQRDQQLVVVVEPVQRRVRIDHVGRPVRPPAREVGLLPFDRMRGFRPPPWPASRPTNRRRRPAPRASAQRSAA